MRNEIVLICLILSIITIGKVQAESVDCSKAESNIKKLICSNKELSDAYETLDKEYKAALQTYPYKEALENNLYSWKYDAEPCWSLCPDATCLLESYREKINEIRTQYLTYFYGGDKYTGVYRNKKGGISILLIPGNKIKVYIDIDAGCLLGSNDNAIATFIDKNHAVYLDNTTECTVLLKFDKNRVTISYILNCAPYYCGPHGDMGGVYFKKGNKPDYSEYLGFSEKEAARIKKEELEEQRKQRNTHKEK